MRPFATPFDRAAGERARLGAAAAAALALLAVLPYANGLTAGFTFDDGAIVRDNPRLAGPEGRRDLHDALLRRSARDGKNYRPVVLLTYAVQRWTTGTDPFPFHLVNVLLHAATTLLLAAWLLALGMPRAPSLAAAALFAVVPIHAEAVTGIVGRAELLVALLVFLSALLFLRATEGPSLRAVAYAGAVAAFLVALFTKEHAVVLPGVVLLGELLRRGADEPLAARLRRKALPAAGLLAPLAVFVAFRALFVGSGLVAKGSAFFELDNPLVTLAAPLRAANGLWLLLRYAAKTLVPLGLSADHSAHALPPATSLADPMAIAGLLGVAALSALALLSVRRLPLVALGLGLFLGAFFPTSNVPFPIGTIFAERLAYLPSAGSSRRSRGSRPPCPALRRLPAGAPRRRPRDVRGDDGREERGLPERRDPLRGPARQGAALGPGPLQRGLPRLGAGRDDRRPLEPREGDRPLSPPLRRLGPPRPRGGEGGAAPEARAAARESLRIKPDYEIGWRTLAKVEEEAGRLDAAEEALAAGLKRFPRSLPLLRRRGAFLLARGRAAESAEAWRTAIAVSGGAREDRLGLERALRAAPR
jgi:hypothetical protein